jgi:ornithine cyclodeaminase
MFDACAPLLAGACAATIAEIEAAVCCLFESNKVVAEGAGACGAAACMFGAEVVQKQYTKVVAVVCGGGIDTSVLFDIVSKISAAAQGGDEEGGNRYLNYVEKQQCAPPSPAAGLQDYIGSPHIRTSIYPESEVDKRLPMKVCIEATASALRALSNKTGFMPQRTIMKLPLGKDASGQDKMGFLGLMPSYMPGYFACKILSVFPGNTSTPFSSHQGVALLFESEHGQLLSIADCHQVTATRTAAASAVATRALINVWHPDVTPHPREVVVAIIGTGTQATAHAQAMLALEELGVLSIRHIALCGRQMAKAEAVAAEIQSLLETSPCHKATVGVTTNVEEAVRGADVVCTVTSARSPIVKGEWLKSGCHVNAVGACQPAFEELDPECYKRARVFTDTKEACLTEPGDIINPIKEGLFTEAILLGEIGELQNLGGSLEGRTSESDVTIFKSLGIALEDLAAVRAVHDAASPK